MNEKDPNRPTIGNFDLLYKSLTDPEERAKRRRKFEREQRVEAKKKDTGL